MFIANRLALKNLIKQNETLRKVVPTLDKHPDWQNPEWSIKSTLAQVHSYCTNWFLTKSHKINQWFDSIEKSKVSAPTCAEVWLMSGRHWEERSARVFEVVVTTFVLSSNNHDDDEVTKCSRLDCRMVTALHHLKEGGSNRIAPWTVAWNPHVILAIPNFFRKNSHCRVSIEATVCNDLSTLSNRRMVLPSEHAHTSKTVKRWSWWWMRLRRRS